MATTQNDNIAYENQKIVNVDMRREVERSFIEYAMSVIVARALPDVRDGLKPVHRRILYAMYEDHLTYDKPFRKSATTVGNVLGRYHPHGDTAVYDSMVRLAQSFSLRYPLVEGHGNFGNIDGDRAAAYRYTEARLAKLAEEMMFGIEKGVVDFTPNYDNKLQEPVVLPSRFPNLLVNGSVGIAVGMATNIPPHNLGEVVDGIICLMENPEAEITELMEHIKGPDFPTRATIYGSNGIYQAYTTGRGKVSVRARAEVDEEHRRIIVTEIPYAVNKAQMVMQMAECHKDKRIEGITDIRDESGKDGLRIVIEYRASANGHVILNQLYKYTQLQDTFAINMLALVNGEPKILNLKEILTCYILHQEEVTVRRLNYDLQKAEHEAHINEGYKTATDYIDEVIDIIRNSASVQDARSALIDRFALSEEQAQAITDMTLGRLAGMERQKVEDKLDKLHQQIAEIRTTLSDEAHIKAIIRDDLLEMKRKYADDRRTELVAAEDEIVLEDLIERHTCIITMSHTGYVKRSRADIYTAQRRGGKGVIGMTTKDEDYVEHMVAVNSHANVMMFTNYGKVQVKKAYLLPEAGRTAKGTNIVNLFELADGEKVTTMLPIASFAEGGYLTMITKKGMVKRTPLSAYAYQRKGGKRALTLAEDDELVAVFHTTGDDALVLATRGGLAVHFHESDARTVGRTARGVRGIRLAEGDYVVGACVETPDQMVVTITDRGFGKRCAFDQFPMHRRGGKGVFCQKVSDKGMLAGIAAVCEDDDLMLMTDDGIMIRTPVAGIPVYSRTAGGVIVMRLAEGSTLKNFARVEVVKEEDVAKADADAALVGTDENMPEEPDLPDDVADEADEADVADDTTDDAADDGE